MCYPMPVYIIGTYGASSFTHYESPLMRLLILHQGGFCLLSVFTGSAHWAVGHFHTLRRALMRSISDGSSLPKWSCRCMYSRNNAS